MVKPTEVVSEIVTYFPDLMVGCEQVSRLRLSLRWSPDSLPPILASDRRGRTVVLRGNTEVTRTWSHSPACALNKFLLPASGHWCLDWEITTAPPL